MHVEAEVLQEIEKKVLGAAHALQELLEQPDDSICLETATEFYYKILPRLIGKALGYEEGDLNKFLSQRRRNIPAELEEAVSRYIGGREIVSLIKESRAYRG